MYVVVAYAGLEAADLLLPALEAPEWIFRVLVGLAFSGFPVAVVLAWFFDLTPAGFESTDSKVVHGSRAAIWLRRGLMALVGVATLALGALALRRGLPEPVVSNPDQVMVFPLVVPEGSALSASVGEDISTMIGHALDRAGSLRWIDAWSAMESEQQADPRRLTPTVARELARARGSGHFVLGRVVGGADSAVVLLDLFDVREPLPVRRASAEGSSQDPWRLGLQAANQLLTALIDEPPQDFGDRFTRRDPAAVAHFLTGESAFRRSRHAEALGAYRQAFQVDPGFADAAIRGAQAASWEHRSDEAALMVSAALSLDLDPRDRAFAEGMRAYLEGDSERALAALERAVSLDPEMAAAHAQLGETYHHLAPSRRRPDSVATVAFERAYAIDSTASGVLYHLAQHRIRAGGSTDGTSLADQLRASASNPDLVAEIDLSVGCVTGGPGAVDWSSLAHAHPGPLMEAAVNLAAGDTRWGCAEAAYRALLAHDTVTTGWEVGRRWSSLKGLHMLLLATGRVEEGMVLLDSARVSLAALRRVADPTAAAEHRPSERDETPVQFAELLFLLDEAAGYPTAGRAAAVAAENRSPSGAYDFDNNFRLWFLGVWEASRGNAVAVRAIARRMEARVATRPGTPRDSLLARAMQAHAALAEGDTTTALEVLRALRPTGDVQWNAADALGLERLTHARVAQARGHAAESRDVSTYLEATPSSYPLFLLPALEVRAEAMEQSMRRSDAQAIRRRIDRLAGTSP